MMMIGDAATEFMDKEIMPHKARFEKKDYALTLETMKKAGD